MRAQRADAIYAVLSMVPHKGAAKMEDRGQQRHVWQMRLWRAPRILDALSLVHSESYIADPSWIAPACKLSICPKCREKQPKMAGLSELCFCKETAHAITENCRRPGLSRF